MKIPARVRFLLLFFAMLPTLFVAQYVVVRLFRDNGNYSAAYNAVGNFPVGEAFLAHYANTGSVEPLYFALSFIVARSGIGYTHFIFALNIVFILSFASFLSSFRVKLSWVLLLGIFVLCSFYPLVFLSELHRLKLALVFLFVYLASLVRSGRGSYFNYFVLGISSHFQSLLMFGSIFLFHSGLSFFRTKFFYFLLAVFVLIFGLTFQKVLYYLGVSLGGFFDTIAICLFILIFTLLFKRRFFYKSLLCVSPLFFASVIFGGGRVNFILIFGFIFFGFYLIGTGKLARDGRVALTVVLLTWCAYGSLLTRNYLTSVSGY